jgi:alpha-beta hydrolase superfamily lysophospholipase
MLHGIQSHSGWYEQSCRRLAEEGLDVRCPDRRGSGLNSLDRGDVIHHERWIHDVHHFLRDIHFERGQRKSPGPVWLCGISWGGKLATAMARLAPDQIQGLILVTPGLLAKVRPGIVARSALTWARWLGYRKRLITIPLQDARLFTSLPKEQERIRNDPLALHQVTLRFLKASAALDQIAIRTEPLLMPVQLMLAERDQIIDNRATRDFFERAAARGLRVHEYAGACHTLELDYCRDDYFRDLVDFTTAAAGSSQRP